MTKKKAPPDERRLDRIEERLGVLIGEGAGAYFQSARRLVGEDIGLQARSSLVWHCAREIESQIRQALGPIAPASTVATPGETRRAEAEAIIETLELPAGDAAVAWWQSNSLHGAAHRNNMGPIRELAIADWRMFVTALETILDHFEARYQKMLDRLDALLMMSPSSAGAEIKNLLCALPPTGRATGLQHFLERADERWLDALPGCILHDPPGPIPVRGEPGYYNIPAWPASQYLAKVAAARPMAVHAKVMDILRKDPTNPWVHRDLAAAAAHFPPAQAAEWATAEAAWIRRQPMLFMGLSLGLTDAVERLAHDHVTDAAFELGAALLALDPAATSGRYGEPGLRVHDYEYEEAFRRIAAALTAIEPLRSCELLVAIVVEGITLAYPRDRQYGSRQWLHAVEDLADERNPTTTEVMLDGLRRALEAAATDRATLGHLAVMLRARTAESGVMERLAIHLVREKRALDQALALAYLAEPGLYAHDSWLEMLRLVEQTVPDLAPSDLPAVRHAIEASALVQAQKDAFLAHVAAADAGAAPPAALQVGPRFVVGRESAPSPVDVATLARWPVHRVIAHIVGYKPDPAVWRDGESLGSDLAAVAEAAPHRYSAAGALLLPMSGSLAPHYFHGLRESLKQSPSRIAWSALVRILESALVTDESWCGDDYREARKAAAWLFEQGIRANVLSLDVGAQRGLWAVLGVLADDGDPTPATETAFLASDGGLESLRLNSVRPIGVSLAVELARWQKRRRKRPGPIPMELRLLIEARLRPHETSLTVRYAIGEKFPVLFDLDTSWATSLQPRIFPSDPALSDVRDAAWRGFLSAPHFPIALIPLVMPLYQAAVTSMSATGSRPHDGLVAMHVFQFVALGVIGPETPDGLVRGLLEHGPTDLLAEAIHNVGWRLWKNSEAGLDREVAARHLVLWQAVAASVEVGRADPAVLSGFGWWFASGFADDARLLGELERIVRLDIAIDDLHFVWGRLRVLANSQPEAIGRLTDLIIAREPDANLLHDENIRDIAERLLAEPDGSPAHGHAQHIVSRMRSRGFGRFPDL